jgi:hypothetical protein
MQQFGGYSSAAVSTHPPAPVYYQQPVMPVAAPKKKYTNKVPSLLPCNLSPQQLALLQSDKRNRYEVIDGRVFDWGPQKISWFPWS